MQAQGDVQGALTYYMKAGLPGRAAQLVMRQPDLANSRELIERVRSCAHCSAPSRAQHGGIISRKRLPHLQYWTHVPTVSKLKTRLVAH